MPTAPFKRLTRRLIWSASASITLLFLTSTSSLPTVAVPPTGFSLELDEIFAKRAGFDLAANRTSRVRAAGLAQFHLDPHAEPGAQATDRYLESLPFGLEIRSAAERYGVDSLLLASIVEAESGFRANAISNKGALGLMQLMPLHFVPIDQTIDPLDPTVNLNLGTRYLRDLRKRYDGNLELALGAYHAGPGTIDRFGGLPPYRETQDYVGRVLRLYSEHQQEVGASAPAKTPPASSMGDLPPRLAKFERGT